MGPMYTGTSGQILYSTGAGALTWVTPNYGATSLDGLNDVKITSAPNIFIGYSGATIVGATTIIRYNTGATITGLNNTIIGDSGKAITSGATNVIIGEGSVNTMTTAYDNVIIGFNIIGPVTNAHISNTLIGASIISSSKLNNVCLGSQVTMAQSYSIGIGYNARTSAPGTSSSISIGWAANSAADYGIVIGESVTTNTANTIIIGNNKTAAAVANSLTIWPNAALANVASGTALYYNSTSGQVGPLVSSRRFKENITDIEIDTTKLYNLRPVSYNYKNEPSQRTIGLIAEEVYTEIPEVVYCDSEGPYSVNYSSLTIILIEENKKLKTELTNISSDIMLIKSDIENMTSSINDILLRLSNANI